VSFYAAPAPSEIFYAAPAVPAPAPILLYSKQQKFKGIQISIRTDIIFSSDSV
jgi:hypothetical protein